MQIRRAQQLVARGRAMEQHRLHMLAEMELAEEDCVSWRGCSHVYDSQTMNTTQSYYDRYDRYPNAWDASASGRWLRDQYPGQAWPAYNGEESVIVGGDPMGTFPTAVRKCPPGAWAVDVSCMMLLARTVRCGVRSTSRARTALSCLVGRRCSVLA